MTHRRHDLTVPDLGLADVPVVVSLWLVDVGDEVTEGDRVIELLAGDVTVDLPAPASGVLVETFVEEDEPVAIGQRLAVVEAKDEG